MGKGGAKQEVTKYYMSIHFGVCVGPVDEMTAITIKEKTAWSGSLTSLTAITFRDDVLFGGIKKEGGATGKVTWLPGAGTQVLPNELATRLGRSSGADCPGYRGIATAFFTGSSTPSPGTDGRPGFFWTANNPYLPGVWITVRRAPLGLDPSLAMIGRGSHADLSTWRYLVVETDDPTDRSAIGYDDSSWSTGNMPFGSGDPTQPTPSTHIAIHKAVWIRRLIPAGVTGLTVTVDDEADVYFNGFHIGDRLEIGTQTIALPGTAGLLAIRAADTVGGYFTLNVVDGSQTGADANPAHIIYEALTNTDWGMGSPSTAINVTAFSQCAQTLFDEAFGMSIIWTRQTTIQEFVQEVLDHIQAVLYVDPATGLLTLTLIRGDYDVATLPIITPRNADLSSFGRKLWGDIANEIVVTWTNPTNEQEETVTAQDLASIATQGSIISDSRNYYGVRSASLAAKLAARDLRSSGGPLASCEAEVDRTLWQVRPASVVKLIWPEYGLDGVVMRVLEVDYGKPGDATIKLKMAEDVFGLDAGSYVTPPSSSWEDPSSLPAPLTIQRVFTLPLFMANETTVASFVSNPTYPEVLAGVLGTSANADTYSYDLWSDVALTNGTTEWQSLGTENVVGHAVLTNPLVAEASSTGVAFGSLIGQTYPTASGFVLIGDTSEEASEIALIDVLADTLTLRRGVLDTVPRAWAAGTPLWFVDSSTIFDDPTVRSVGEDVEYKLLSRTSRGQLALSAATLLTYTLTERPWQPNRPGDVHAYGAPFTSFASPINAIGRSNPWVTVTWANRNRLTEDSQILGWTDSTVTPETGQTTTITVLAPDLTVLATHTGLTGTSFNVPDADFGSIGLVIIRVSSSRTDADGTFESLQWFDHWVKVGITGGADSATGVGSASFAGSGFGGTAGSFAGVGSAGIVGRLIATGAMSASGAASASSGGALGASPIGTPYRYVGVRVLTTGSSYTSCAQLSLYENGGSTDRALSGTAGVDFVLQAGSSASFINDNNAGTFAVSNAGTLPGSTGVFWIDFGAGNAYAISKFGWAVRNDTPGADEKPRTWEIVGKQNAGDPWTVISTLLPQPTWAQGEYREIVWPAVTYPSAKVGTSGSNSIVPVVASGPSPVFASVGTPLPAGMSLDTSTGVISGAPTSIGTTSGLQISVSAGGGTGTSAPFSITAVAGSYPIAQQASVVGNNPALTLPAAPTVGNLLVIMGTHWRNFSSLSGGWSSIVTTNGGTDDGVIGIYKVVTSTEAASATLANPAVYSTGTSNADGSEYSIFEINGASLTGLTYDQVTESTGTTKTLTVTPPSASSLVVGFFGTVNSNVAPTSITGATAGSTVTGTSTFASPRQITPFSVQGPASGALAITSNYAASQKQYGVAVAVTLV